MGRLWSALPELNRDESFVLMVEALGEPPVFDVVFLAIVFLLHTSGTVYRVLFFARHLFLI